jgi:PAS domain S-box-containing protein
MGLRDDQLTGTGERGTSIDELVLERLFEGAPVGLAFVDRELRYQRINPRLAEINGHPVEAHIGRTPTEVLGEIGAGAEALLAQILRTGEPLLDAEFTIPDGRHFVVSYSPVHHVDGELLGILAVVQDVTARKEVELDLSRALDHSTRLQQVAASLSAALTIDEVAGVITRASMDVLGGTCGVLGQRIGPQLEIRHRFGMAGRPPSSIPLSADLPMPEAVRSRAPVVVGSRNDWLTRWPQSPPRGDFDAFVAVPLLFEGRATGCMGIGLGDARVPDDRELALLGAIARQGAQALERARLYEERAYVAATLQQGLLPAVLPEIEGLEVAVAYRPVGDGAEVGGDFYDLVDLGGERWLAAVGDVCGKGAPAAVLSGLVRTTLNAVAQRGDRPADILALANRAILRHASGRADYATAVCAVLERSGDGFRAVLGSAGHPPALILRAGGELEAVDHDGVMLGVGQDPQVTEQIVELARGDVLVLHTDGITDARVSGELFGEQRLRDLLRESGGLRAEGIAQRIDEAVRAFQAGPPPDDAALMVLRAV